MITVDWPTGVITVPQSYLTNLGGGIYELDVDQFRLDLKSLEDDEEGIPWPQTHSHNTEVILSGVTYARTLEIINGYTVEFEDGHNLGDVKVVNQVSLMIGNSAGLITVVSGSGVTEQDKADIAALVWEELAGDHSTAGTLGEKVAEKLLTTAEFLTIND
jgi:hypothetical protein